MNLLANNSAIHKKIIFSQEILDTIGQWKIISVKNLFKSSLQSCHYESFRRKLRELEKKGFIKSKRYYKNIKYVYLTELGYKFANGANILIPNHDIFIHDLLVSEILFEFIKYKKICEINCYPEGTETLEPDGVMKGLNKGIDFSIALEVELTQKSKSRVLSKFNEYAKSSLYQFVVFITNNQRLASTYNNLIQEVPTKSIGKFVIIYVEGMLPSNVNFNNSVCFFNGGVKPFKYIFGDEKLLTLGLTGVVTKPRPDQNTQQLQTFT